MYEQRFHRPPHCSFSCSNVPYKLPGMKYLAYKNCTRQSILRHLLYYIMRLSWVRSLTFRARALFPKIAFRAYALLPKIAFRAYALSPKSPSEREVFAVSQLSPGARETRNSPERWVPTPLAGPGPALLAGSQLIPWVQGEKDPTREVRPFSGNWSDFSNRSSTTVPKWKINIKHLPPSLPPQTLVDSGWHSSSEVKVIIYWVSEEENI